MIGGFCNDGCRCKARNVSCCGAIPRRVEGDDLMAGAGSTGNVIAAVCSFFIPGLGQLVQGRVLMALIQFVLAGVLWVFFLGWLIHIWSIIDAAVWKPKTA
jgi:TM2 domain-containing membrane protein YozV